MSQHREKIWVVRAGDGTTLGDVLRRLGETAGAIEDGRVFVGKKRALRFDQPVRVGDAVRVGAAVTARADVTIVFHEDDLVACIKPAGLPTVPDHAGAAHSLVALVAKQLATKPDDLRVTSRLDRDVSGVVVFAIGDEAEHRLRNARAEGRYDRRYVAIAMPPPAGDEGTWDAPIGRASDPRLRAAFGPEAKPSTTRWHAVATAGNAALLAVDPMTGRTHQIRIHASHAGSPLVGDRDYGGSARIVLPNGRVLAPSRIALHAACVRVPGIGRSLEGRAPIPDELDVLWRAFGGAPDAWERAVDAER